MSSTQDQPQFDLFEFLGGIPKGEKFSVSFYDGGGGSVAIEGVVQWNEDGWMKITYTFHEGGCFHHDQCSGETTLKWETKAVVRCTASDRDCPGVGCEPSPDYMFKAINESAYRDVVITPQESFGKNVKSCRRQ